MGLIKTALKTAVAVKTAHFVHDRIQQRQQQPFAANEATGTNSSADAGQMPMPDTLAMLSQLDDLKTRGVLTEPEFQAQKARILRT